jgi:hypothetical protein
MLQRKRRILKSSCKSIRKGLLNQIKSNNNQYLRKRNNRQNGRCKKIYFKKGFNNLKKIWIKKKIKSRN